MFTIEKINSFAREHWLHQTLNQEGKQEASGNANRETNHVNFEVGLGCIHGLRALGLDG
jgi:hypothetical protein